MEKTKICFNTSRLYTDEGQVITATLTTTEEGGIVRFHDHSRMIHGSFLVTDVGLRVLNLRGEEALARCIMSHYDRGDYSQGFEFSEGMAELRRDDGVTPTVYRL